MGAGTREAERLAEQQNEGPFLVLFEIGGGVGAGMFTHPIVADTLEDVQAHVEAGEKASNGNVTVRSIKLSKVLIAAELVEAVKRLMKHERAPQSLVRDMSVDQAAYDVEKILKAAGEKV